MALDANTIEKIIEIFDSKGWDIEYEEGSVFNKYCSLMEILNAEQRDLMLDIGQDFLWIKFKEYYKYIIKSLNTMPNNTFDQYDRIYIYNLAETLDSTGRNESGVLVRYAFNDPDISTHRVFKGKELVICGRIEAVPKNVLDSKNALLVVDDFIGSGETALTCIGNILKEKRVAKENIYILAMVAQMSGIDEIESLGVKVFCGQQRGKGISDKYTAAIKEIKTKIMQDIEDIVKPNEGYKFGYKRSEALVRMIRTPNNTFPVYWLKFKHNGKKIIPPFERI